jgi:hypothetical protein
VNTKYVWVSLKRKERRNKLSLKDKANQLSKSLQGTEDRNSSSDPSYHIPTIKSLRKKGGCSNPTIMKYIFTNYRIPASFTASRTRTQDYT